MGGSKMDVMTKVSSARRSPLQVALLALMGVAIVTLPIIFQGFGMPFMVRIMAIVSLYVLLALGLNIVVGYAGLLDLGYIAFYGVGAYVGTNIMMTIVNVFGQQLGGWAFFLALPVAAAFAALTGLALGTPVLRLRGDYLAIVTLGFGEIVRICLVNDIFGLTNGPAGLPRMGQSLPLPLGLQWLMDHAFFSTTIFGQPFDFSFRPEMYWFYIGVLLCMGAIFMVQRLDNSRLGRSWTAMREDEVAAASMGVNIMTAKLWAFSLGALSGGVAGVVFANMQGLVTPESFVFMESVYVVCIVVLGGMGSIPGVILGAIVIQGVPELLNGLATTGIVPLSGEQQSAIVNYRYLVFGLLMVVMMAVRPQGMWPSQRRAMELRPEDEKILDEENQALWEAQHKTDTDSTIV